MKGTGYPKLSMWHRWMPLCMVLTFPIFGCQSPSSTQNAEGKSNAIQVVATVGMVADLVRIVGGDEVRVSQMMGSGVDPHLYKATSDDIRMMMNADLVFACGLMLEGRLQDTLEKLDEKTSVVFVADQLPRELLVYPEGAAGHPDPHVWMDVSAWANCLPAITEALSKLRPEAKEAFQLRAQNLQAELRTLHEFGLAAIATIPESQRVLVTSHDAFHYFGRAYGLEVVGVQGISTESEAGLQRINELVDLLVERKVSAVFVESSVSQKNILALIDGAKSRGHQVRVGGELFSDAMGSEGTTEGTYAGMLRHNIETVTRALRGETMDDSKAATTATDTSSSSTDAATESRSGNEKSEVPQ